MLERIALIRRWAARVLGDRLPRMAELGPQERMMFVGWAAMLLGMALAWRREGHGSLMTLAGIACWWVECGIAPHVAAPTLCGGRLHAHGVLGGACTTSRRPIAPPELFRAACA